jgi:hypothetical protein
VERKKYNRDNFYKLLQLKNCVLTLNKAIHLGGTKASITSYTPETKYLETGGKSFSKVTIADINLRYAVYTVLI